MAGATQRIVAGPVWSKLIGADRRDCLVLIDAYGPIEIAVAEGEAPDASIARGHSVTGRYQVLIRGRDIVWAKGSGAQVFATAFKNIPTFGGSGPAQVNPPEPSIGVTATDSDGQVVVLIDADGTPVTLIEA
ncbi:hypothetical protein [Paracoccus shanxieyensis]|uniref:Uncharacterized protein n=1 Tax=Paracoccus shanxieyensis TaxID=2675752 RepID=A0A6L6J2T1_9RHOB|nr:hypothetical protein [Paracoccus shanxieyensis]MTH65064.1 hypothetical protein [Paracoccus shanxieyensis]MTH88208.1 hypothetical protein [Paracoccus shanxieyensis]